MVSKNRIAELREARGLSRWELGLLLEPPARYATLLRWETGKTGIPDKRKAELARFFGVSISYLMGWEEEPEGAGWPE